MVIFCVWMTLEARQSVLFNSKCGRYSTPTVAFHRLCSSEAGVQAAVAGRKLMASGYLLR